MMSMWWTYGMQDDVIRAIQEGARQSVSTEAFLDHEIALRRGSKVWRAMCDGQAYYLGRHDVMYKCRTAIGDDGNPITINNLPNNRFVDNVYRRMVKQKTNYLLGKPFSVTSDNDQYQEALADIFDKSFMRQLKNVGRDALNCGIGWLYPYYNEKGIFRFRRFNPIEIIPEWTDADHTQLDCVIRFYDVDVYNGHTDETVTKVELYTLEGVDYYEYYNGEVKACPPWHTDYMTIGGKSYNWEQLPFIAFKANDEEQPLITCCKSLQDGLNTILSNFGDNMQEDSRNTILVLVNYDGTNLGEFRRNLATYGAVKVRSTGDGVSGDVKTLQIEVNAENYKAIVQILKNEIIENCMGYDSKDERMSGTPNQMNIQSMYNDVDLDASDMETEFQAAMDEVLDFVDIHLANSGKGDYKAEQAKITFNTSMPMDETSVIQNAVQSQGIISDETILAHHPWVDDPAAEMDRLDKQRKKEQEEAAAQYDPYGNQGINQTNTNPTGQDPEKDSK